MTQHLDRLYFSRESERRTSDDKLLDGLQFIAQKALTGSHGRRWGYEVGSIEAERVLESSWLFTSWIRFYRRLETTAERESAQRESIYRHAALAGHHARFGAKPWVCKVDRKIRELQAAQTAQAGIEAGSNGNGTEQEQSRPAADPLDDEQESVPLASISRISKGHYFDHLFGLDPQIRVLLSAIQAAADSKKKNRFHALLYGEPGAGKTDILRSTARLLDDLRISYVEIDATATTEAGMKKVLLDEDEIVPEVLLIEEIEKSPGNSTHWLLGVMDDRATVTQLNYKRQATRKVDSLVLASANDYALLKVREKGALLSRFNNHIYCPRPTREIIGQILKREILAVGGSLDWIEPTLEFCVDRRHMTDPRAIVPVCLQGKERLASGEYQRDLMETMREEIENGIERVGAQAARIKPDLEIFS